MKIILSFFLLLALSASVLADRITATITITSVPADAATITVNGTTRTWKTTVVTPSTQVLIGDIGGSATNLYFHAITYILPTALNVQWSGTNVVKLTAQNNGPMTVSLSAAYGTVVYSTQTVTAATLITVPQSSEPSAAKRTNNMSQLVSDIGTYSTTSFPQTAVTLANFVNLNQAQDVGNKNLTNITGQLYMVTNHLGRNGLNQVTNGIYFQSLALTNTYLFGQDSFGYPNVFKMPDFSVETNLPAYDSSVVTFGLLKYYYPVLSAFRTNSWSSANWFGDTIVTNISVLSGTVSNVYLTNAIGINGTVFTMNGGTYVNPTSTNATITNAARINGVVFALTNGFWAFGGMTNSALTNSTFEGTANLWNGSIAHTRTNVSSLANGNNSGLDFSGKKFVKLKAGPTAAFNINGIGGGSDGRELIIYNSTAQNMTIVNDSGVDATAANRILTNTGADVTTTAAGVVTLIYDSEVSRWIVTAVQL